MMVSKNEDDAYIREGGDTVNLQRRSNDSPNGWLEAPQKKRSQAKTLSMAAVLSLEVFVSQLYLMVSSHVAPYKAQSIS
jgi:hypothetical protein